MNDHLREFLGIMGMKLPLHRENWFHDLDGALQTAEDELLSRLGIGSGSPCIAVKDTILADGLSASQAAILERHLTRRVFKAGDYVFRKGEKGDSLFVAGESTVDIQLPLHGDKKKRVASFAPGNVFGEMALLEGKPRSADAIVQETGVVWELTQDSLTEIELKHREIVGRLLLNLSRSLAHRVRTTTEHSLAAASGEEFLRVG